METKKGIPLLLLLLQACIIRCQSCLSQTDESLTCYSDFNRTVDCAWHSTAPQMGSACRLTALSQIQGNKSDFCHLVPINASNPAVKTCSLVIGHDYFFDKGDVLDIDVNCNSTKPALVTTFVPSCHIKVKPGRPVVSSATISWEYDQMMINQFSYELQWKRQNQPWSNANTQKREHQEGKVFKRDLDEDMLIRGETYEARVRMKPDDEDLDGPWGDWSPVVSWVSTVGQAKQPTAFTAGVWQVIIGVAVAALALVAILFRMNKADCVYIMKKLRGPPLPNPAKSFLQEAMLQGWLSPHSISEPFHFFPHPVEIVSVEVTSAVDAITSWSPNIMSGQGNHKSCASRFSNPSYSALGARLRLDLMLTAGNLDACEADTPYGPVGSEASEPTGMEGGCGGAGEKKADIRELFSQGNGVGGQVVVISDYEKAEKLQFERFRLQSLDSGVCSGEEVSQESVDPDGASGHEEDADGERDQGGGMKVDFHKLFGSCGGVVGGGSIQVCSDYKSVQKLSSRNPELWRCDSGSKGRGPGRMGDIAEEESTESTGLLLPPHPPGALPCSFLATTLTLPGPRLSPALESQRSPSLGQIAMTTGGPMEPSGEGYMPVRQERS